MDFEQKNVVELNEFRQRVPHAIRKEPFNYTGTPTYASGDYLNYVSRLLQFVKLSPFSQGSIYSPYAFDALYAYALAVNHTIDRGDDIHDGRALISEFENLYFVGESSYEKSSKNAYDESLQASREK